MFDALPTLTLRHANGRDEELDRDALLSRVASGGLAEGALVRQGADGPWQQLARWYLDNSEIHALPDPEDTAYVADHVAGVIDHAELRALLGVPDGADRIDFNHDITVAPDPIVVPAWGRGGVDPRLSHIEIPVPHMAVEAIDEVNAAIRVPSWGRPYDLHAEISIPIPAWQDPAHAIFQLPPLVTQSWEQVAVVGGVEPAKKRRRPPRSVALPAVPNLVWVEPPTPSALPSAAGPTSDGERDAAEAERADAALQQRALQRVRRVAQARAKQGKMLSRAALRALFQEEVEALRRAEGGAPSAALQVDAVEAPPATGRDVHGRHRPAARIQPAARLQAAPRVAPAPVPAMGKRTNQPPAGSAAVGATRTVEATDDVATAAAAAAELPWVAEQKGWGCLGCLGQLAALAGVALAVTIALDLGAQRFVASELGVALSGTDPELSASGRALRSPLIQLGPTSSPVVAVLAADLSTDAGAKLLRQTLAVLRPGEHRDDVPGSGKIRLVLLPAGQGVAADDAAKTALVLHRMGVFWRQVARVETGVLSAERMAMGLADDERARLAKETVPLSTLLQARTFETMATGLGLDAPQLLVNGVRLHGASLRDRKAMDEVVGLLLKGARSAYRATGRADKHYWAAMASVMEPRPRQRFLSWMIRGERVPTTPPKAPRPHPVAPTKPTKPAKRTKAKPKAPAHVTFQVPHHAPRLGPESAPVKVVLFADLSCRFCRKIAPRLRQLQRDFGDDLQLSFVHYPLRKLHPDAQELAELAVIAHKRGHFWALYDYAYTPGDVDPAPAAVRGWLTKTAGRKALALERSERRRARRQIRQDRRLGRKLKLRGTPTVFVNGWRVNGAVSYERLRTVVLRELAKGSGGPKGAPRTPTASPPAPPVTP